MGRQIIKQPNGKYAIWSTIVDDFIFFNMTAEEWIQFRIRESAEQVRKDIEEIISKLEKGEKPYYQFTETWDDLFERLSILGKKDRVKEIKNILKITTQQEKTIDKK